MKKNLIIILLTLVTLGTACSTSRKTTASKNSRETNEIEISVPNYTSAELEEGKMLWESKCDRCHKLYLPESHSKARWEAILPRMSKRSKLNEDQAGKVRGYIMAHAKA